MVKNRNAQINAIYIIIQCIIVKEKRGGNYFTCSEPNYIKHACTSKCLLITQHKCKMLISLPAAPTSVSRMIKLMLVASAECHVTSFIYQI